MNKSILLRALICFSVLVGQMVILGPSWSENQLTLTETMNQGHVKGLSCLLAQQRCMKDIKTMEKMIKTAEVHLDKVKELLANLPESNEKRSPCSTAIAITVARSHVLRLNEIFAQLAGPERAIKFGSLALISAAASGDLQHMRTMCGQTPGYCEFLPEKSSIVKDPTAQLNLDKVQKLLQKLPNVDAAEAFKKSELASAIVNGQLEKVKDILAKNPDVNNVGTVGCTPLILAAASGQVDIVKELIKHGADVNRKGCLDSTALMWASWKGHTEVVKELLTKGANVDSVDESGCSAWSYAACAGHKAIAKILLERSACFAEQDWD